MIKKLFSFYSKGKRPHQFKVRVKHYTNDVYIIQYSHDAHGWLTLKKWIDFGPSSAMSCWNPVLLRVQEAEVVAQKFKTIEDIQAYNSAEQEKERFSVRQRQEFLQKHVPYNTKEF